MVKIRAAKHLSDEEYSLLLTVQAAHSRSMGLEQRKEFTLSDIVNIERNIQEKCLNIHYKCGNWWHYSTDGTWY